MNPDNNKNQPFLQKEPTRWFFQKTLSESPLYLLLLPVFFLWNGYNELFGWIPGISLLLTGTGLYLTLGLIYWLVKKIFYSKRKSALFTAVTMLLILMFGYLHDAFKQLLPDSRFTSYSLFVPICTGMVFVIYLLIYKHRSNFSKIILYCNTLLLMLVGTEMLKSCFAFAEYRKTKRHIDPRFTVFNCYRQQPLSEHEKPDIFFLVFDEMASSKSLMQKCGINHAPLETYLKKEGFYIASDARSNYDRTFFSVSSTFNMEYLPVKPKDDLADLFRAGHSMLNNSLMQILQKEHYATYQLQPISSNNKDWPDVSIFDERRNLHLFYKTLPGRIARDLGWNLYMLHPRWLQQKEQRAFEDKKKSIYEPRKRIKELCSLTEHPKFVYGHFMLPHAPHFFRKNGTFIPYHERIQKSEYDLYREQLLFADSLIRDITSFIKTHNRNNTIIIIAGDHGYRYQTQPRDAENFEIFCSVYFPDRQYGALQQNLSPVNYFRIILNQYFHCKLKLLPHRSYITVTTQEGKMDHDLH